MGMTNAERQRRFRQRMKEKALHNGEPGALTALRNAIEEEADGADARPVLARLTLALGDAVASATAGHLSDGARARFLAVMAGELHGHHGPDMAPHLRRAEVERMTVAELARAIEARGGTAPKKARKAELVAIVVAAEKEEAHHDG